MITNAVDQITPGNRLAHPSRKQSVAPEKRRPGKGARLTQLERDLARSNAAAAAMRDDLAAIQRIAESVPAIGRVLAQTARSVESIALQRAEEAQSHVSAASAASDSLAALQHQISHLLQRGDEFERLFAEFENERQDRDHRLQRLEALSALPEKQNSHDEAVSQQIAELNAAVAELIAGQHELGHRIEFVRREIMFEMKHGIHVRAPDVSLVDSPRVVNHVKVAGAREGAIRLNLGCGHLPLEGYLNVDMRSLDGVDIVAAADDLPFAAGTVDEIFSSHLIEHFPQEELRRKLLPYWRSLLHPGGCFHAIVPDAAAMIEEAAKGIYEFEEFREVLFGAQDYIGDYHFNALTPASLQKLLIEAGFINVEVVDAARRNGKCFEFEINAYLPASLESHASS